MNSSKKSNVLKHGSTEKSFTILNRPEMWTFRGIAAFGVGLVIV